MMQTISATELNRRLCLAEGVLEQHAFADETIEIGCLDRRVEPSGSNAVRAE